MSILYLFEIKKEINCSVLSEKGNRDRLNEAPQASQLLISLFILPGWKGVRDMLEKWRGR